jgi:6-phosphogluconate dehydrogenase
MEIGFIGLGKMGMNMVQRLVRGKHHVVAYDRSSEPVREAEKCGGVGAHSLEDLIRNLASPRMVWVMVPAGDPTEKTISQLAGLMQANDVIIDGGNSNFHDDIRRAQELKAKEIHYLDVGTSGGIWGLQAGYCLMVGGEEKIYKRLEPFFKTLAPEQGYGYMGLHGAGHYVKMIHNGIEYGLMQTYAEGFELLQKSEYSLDLPQIAKLWNHGSVVRSWLLELAARELEKDPKLEHVKGYVEDSGEGRWTIQEAIAKNVPASVITLSLFNRFRSRQEESFGDKVLAVLRNAFGGHSVQRKE